MIKKLKAYMNKNCLSQLAMANMLGTNTFTMSRWLNGHNKPSQAYQHLILSITK